ncbi:MAG: hypothetical protein HDT27_03775 [Subdoligranulum sp.]|nr:hypothetical protein [Subdoligranulum sp.]
MGSCFFIGNHDAPPEMERKLRAVVEQHITAYGVVRFVVGHYGAYDAMAARAVAEAKKSHPDISLTILLPYYPAAPDTLPQVAFDDTLYPSEMESVPKRLAITRANRYVIDRCDYLIAYVHTPGNARKFLEYAQRRERRGLLTITEL